MLDAAAIIAIISVSATAGGAFITALFHSLSLSRCSEIDCCCWKCKREVLSEDTYKGESSTIRHLAHPVNPGEELAAE
jgi:hypothetical protein